MQPQGSWYVAAALGLALLSGCVKPPSTKVDYGSESNEADVEAAFTSAQEPITFESLKEDIKLNSYVVFHTDQTIRGSQVITPIKDVAVTVTDKAFNDEIVGFQFTQSEIKYDSDDNVPLTREFESFYKKSDFEKKSTQNTLDFNALNLAKIFRFSPQGLKILNESTPKVSYYNLKVEKKLISPPEKVLKKSDCGGLVGCQMRVVEISYDIVFWTTEDGEKYHIKYALSPDVPLLFVFESDKSASFSSIIEFCNQTSLPYEDQRLLVTQCKTLKDFQFGSDEQ